MTDQVENKKSEKKVQGPIRWEAIIPTTLIIGLFYCYMHFFLDHHLRKLIEIAGYHIVGAEVNVGYLKTSFWKSSIEIRDIELTDSENPSHNVIKIGDVRFNTLWDALLRAKFVINEIAVEQIEFNAKRKQTGKVKPPEPPPVDDGKPSAAEIEARKVGAIAISKVQNKYKDNVLGDLISTLNNGGQFDINENINSTFVSKQMLSDFELKLKEKQTYWSDEFKKLPQGSEFEQLGKKISAVKTKDFKSPQELQKSLEELNSILKDADEKIKKITTATQNFDKDIKAIDSDYKKIQNQIDVDIKNLQSQFKFPNLDAQSLAFAIFHQYLDKYLGKFNYYRRLVEQYAPPKLIKKDGKEDTESELQPHPRAEGISYEFGRPNAYPLFWIKRIGISSQAGLSPNSGNVKGEILHISSNQKTSGKPTAIELKADFPSMSLVGFHANILLDNTGKEFTLKYLLGVKSYALGEREIIQSKDLAVKYTQAVLKSELEGHLIAFKNFNMKLSNIISEANFVTTASNKTVYEIVDQVFKGLPLINLNAELKGVLPSLDMDIESNIGSELQSGFNKQISAQIEVAKKALQQKIDAEIGQQKEKIELQIADFKKKYEADLKKLQDQIDQQKKSAEEKIESSKKQSESQAKKEIEKQGKKLIDDLKKKFGK